MHDFGDIVYLDVQKTGSTFISAFLSEACKTPEQRCVKHGRIKDDYRPEAFYFISTRHPIRQYKSLYRYGVDQKGQLFGALRDAGQQGFYERNDSEGLNAFIRYVLNPDNAAMVGEGYEKTCRYHDVGFFTHRHLMLSLPRASQLLHRGGLSALNPFQAKPDLRKVYPGQRIFSFCIRQERLEDDLTKLYREIKPQAFDQDKAAAFLAGEQRINTSSRSEKAVHELDAESLALIRRKEALLIDEFYADDNGL